MGEVTQVWRQGIYGKSLYFPLNFAMNLKLLFKKKNYLESDFRFLICRIEKIILPTP